MKDAYRFVFGLLCRNSSFFVLWSSLASRFCCVVAISYSKTDTICTLCPTRLSLTCHGLFCSFRRVCWSHRCGMFFRAVVFVISLRWVFWLRFMQLLFASVSLLACHVLFPHLACCVCCRTCTLVCTLVSSTQKHPALVCPSPFRSSLHALFSVVP